MEIAATNDFTPFRAEPIAYILDKKGKCRASFTRRHIYYISIICLLSPRCTTREIVAERVQPISVLDVLLHTEQWLNWSSPFSPLSGHASKLDDPIARYLATTFCCACNLGPSQTARSLRGLDRRDVSWVSQHLLTEEKLDEAIRSVIAAYNRFHLPKCWSTGTHASADGTKWEMYLEKLSCFITNSY